MKNLTTGILLGLCFMASTSTACAQVNAGDSVMSHARGHRFSIGGYGEVALSRNFYSDNVFRYYEPAKYKNKGSHGRFDLPHVVIYMGYDFGKGWSMGSEIEFEHGGTGSAYEREYEEGGEWEVETEKGGEVELEQFWIQKSFSRALNLRIGHIVVPVGLNNAHHEPLNFFTVYRPEGENTILPSTWHQTGVSLWGRYSKFKYELQFLEGLDAMQFDRDGWIHKGSHSAFEFEPASKYAVAARIDYYAMPGVRIGMSGYYGHSINNTLMNDSREKLTGAVSIGSVDFTWNRNNWIVRGQATYGHLDNAYDVKYLSGRSTKTSPYSSSEVGKNAVAIGIEAGYDMFSQIQSLRADKQKMYVFGRYDYYNPYIRDARQAAYTYEEKNVLHFGVNYYPLPQIVVKCEYGHRFFKKIYNNEPSLNIGVAYEGFFL